MSCYIRGDNRSTVLALQVPVFYDIVSLCPMFQNLVKAVEAFLRQIPTSHEMLRVTELQKTFGERADRKRAQVRHWWASWPKQNNMQKGKKRWHLYLILKRDILGLKEFLRHRLQGVGGLPHRTAPFHTRCRVLYRGGWMSYKPKNMES